MEEMSRVTIEDEYTLIIVDVPITEERNNQTYCVTIPWYYHHGRGDYHHLFGKLPLLDIFIHMPAQLLYFYEVTFLSFRFSTNNAELYLTAPLHWPQERADWEPVAQIHAKWRNWLSSWSWKTIVYFKASLKTNERVIKKLTSSTSNIKSLEDEDFLLEDTLLRPSRPLRWLDIYGNILTVWQVIICALSFLITRTISWALALVTIVITILDFMIFSAYGMNLKIMNCLCRTTCFLIIMFIAFAMSVFGHGLSHAQNYLTFRKNVLCSQVSPRQLSKKNKVPYPYRD